MSCAGHQKQKPVPESMYSLLCSVLTYTVCILLSSNEGIGLHFPDHDNCCLAGEKGMWCTQTSLRSSCSRMDSTGNLLGSRSPGECSAPFVAHIPASLLGVLLCSDCGESGSVSDMG